MARSNILHVAPPHAGVIRGFSFQEEPPYSCVDSVNFWPIDVFDGRKVSATRPPLVAITPPDDPVNLVAQLNVPNPTLLAAANGLFYKFNGIATWTVATATGTAGVTAGRAVYSTPYLKKLFIFNDDTPLVYDYDTNTLAEWAATSGQGTVPENCRVGCTSQGCIWLGGAPESPHIFYISGTSDPFNWDFSADVEDEGGAFAATGEQEGLITEPITAMFPLSDDKTVIACEASMWVFTGHPRRNGRLDNVSQSVGILGQGAWCRTPSNGTFFISKNGVMTLNSDGTPQPISRHRIPDQLIGLDFDADDPKISMAYDFRWNGIIITVRGDQEQSWLLDPESYAFFEMTFDHYPHVLMHFDPFNQSDTSGVVWGGVGYGGLARFDRTGTEAMPAGLQLIGPMKISESTRYKSLIQRVDMIFGGGTTEFDGTVEVYCAPNGQAAVFRARSQSGLYSYSTDVENILDNGQTMLPRVAGHAFILALRQPAASTKRIVFEGAAVEHIPAGVNRDSGLVAPVLDVPTIIPLILTS